MTEYVEPTEKELQARIDRQQRLHWKHLQALNKLPLNEFCRQLLHQAKVEVSGAHLYSLQVLDWALENLEQEGHWGRVQPELQEYVSRAGLQDPNLIQRYLFGADDLKLRLPEGCSNLLEQLQGKSLEDAAALLLENYQDNLASVSPYFRPPTSD